MREQGMSVKAIARELGVAQSSVSIWTRGLAPTWPKELRAFTPRRLPVWNGKDLQRCGRCGRDLPSVAFSRHRQRRQWWCRACFRDYQAARSHRARELALARRERGRRLIAAHLEANPCVDCGERDIVVLEFDHLRDKAGHIGDLAYRGAAVDRLQAEIDKCEVVCCACHRRRTVARRGIVASLQVSPAVRRNLEVVAAVLAAGACVDCGEGETLLLDFDHLGAKRAPVGRLARDGVSLATLEAEIAVCAIRCIRCHRRRTAKQFGWWRTAPGDDEALAS